METKTIKFVLKNGENSLEFDKLRTMRAYKNRFCQLFPDLDSGQIKMFKVVIYPIEN